MKKGNPIDEFLQLVVLIYNHVISIKAVGKIETRWMGKVVQFLTEPDTKLGSEVLLFMAHCVSIRYFGTFRDCPKSPLVSLFYRLRLIVMGRLLGGS